MDPLTWIAIAGGGLTIVTQTYGFFFPSKCWNLVISSSLTGSYKVRRHEVDQATANRWDETFQFER